MAFDSTRSLAQRQHKRKYLTQAPRQSVIVFLGASMALSLPTDRYRGALSPTRGVRHHDNLALTLFCSTRKTGSGKTWTIEGGHRQFEDRGLIPRALSYIYNMLAGMPEKHGRVESL
jgi:hypothetical protein